MTYSYRVQTYDYLAIQQISHLIYSAKVHCYVHKLNLECVWKPEYTVT